MEFSQRGAQQNQTASAPGATNASAGHSKAKGDGASWMRIATVVLLFSISVLLIALAVISATGGQKAETKYVNSSQYQAVFLNGGQVYFGQIKTLNEKFIRVQDIYYLRVNQTVQPNQTTSTAASNDVSLVKLGCELHGPQDEMLINRDQVIFWENLKTDGQVAKAVSDYKKQNPNGQKCDTTAATPAATPTTTKK